MISAYAAVEPVQTLLKVLRGSDYAAEFELFADEEHTEPFDLTGWEVTMTRNGLVTLTGTTGLSVPTPVNGIVDLALPSATTLTYSVGRRHFVLWLAKETTKLVPVVGTFQVANP